MPRTWILRALAAILAAGVITARGAEIPEYRLKAELIERFTRFVDWPADKSADESVFTICVFESNPFGPALEEVAASRRIKNHPVEVLEVSRVTELAACRVLFIPSRASDSLEKILMRTKTKPVLTVGDTPGFGERGVLINFYLERENVRFEINEAAVRKSGLEMSSRLLKLARILPGEGQR
ncbi:MAG: YfiR family protein [Acidobacteria bacterium]|nr:YfiR family protein [Acidobacteriota bacterium]MCK6684106.1 YfiR family protein [Thermoanaerobaculia bacterium]